MQTEFRNLLMYLCQAMKTGYFQHPRVRQGLTILLLSGALACIFPPATPEFQWWAQQSVGVSVTYVCLGLCFLISNNSRLMFVCLGCGAVISFHYHEKAQRADQFKSSVQLPKVWQIPNDVKRQKPLDFPTLQPVYEPAQPSQ